MASWTLRKKLISSRMMMSYHGCRSYYYSTSTPILSSSQRRRQFHTKENPYLVLGIPTGSDYDTVKQAFLKAAMSHHPDRQESSSSSASSCTKEFIRIRHAFEAIVAKQKNGSSSSNFSIDDDDDDDEFWRSDQDLYPYFAHSTNEFLTFQMDDATRHEVIRVYETMSQGGKDRGGYWEMARQLAEREEAHHLMNAGTTRSNNNNNNHQRHPVRQLTTGQKDLKRRRKKR